MIEPLLRAYCESPKRWLIATGVTLLLGLVLLLPTVDFYYAQKTLQEELSEELFQAEMAISSLEGFEKRVALQKELLKSLQSRAVEGGSIGDFRNKLVEITREAGCQLRRLDVGRQQNRAWKSNDNPTAKQPPEKGGKTGFQLERRSVTLAVTGRLESIKTLLEQLQDEQFLVHARSMDLKSESRSRKQIELDIELWAFALSRG